MKYKTTTKELKQGYRTIIRVGYCDLQNLLSYESPIAYNSGVYGWNYYVYHFGGVAIVTGYRGMPSKNATAEYTTVKKYDDMAIGKTREERTQLIDKFIMACIE